MNDKPPLIHFPILNLVQLAGCFSRWGPPPKPVHGSRTTGGKVLAGADGLLIMNIMAVFQKGATATGWESDLIERNGGHEVYTIHDVYTYMYIIHIMIYLLYWNKLLCSNCKFLILWFECFLFLNHIVLIFIYPHSFLGNLYIYVGQSRKQW